MKAKIVTQGLQVTAAVKDYVARRLAFAFDNTQQRVRSAVVRLADINGPRGGIDKTCSVQLSLPGQPPVIVTESSNSLERAVDRAVSRAAQAVARRLGKQRKHGDRTDKWAKALGLNAEQLPQHN